MTDRPRCEDCLHARAREKTVACAKGYWIGRLLFMQLGEAPKACRGFESMDGPVEVGPRENPQIGRIQ